MELRNPAGPNLGDASIRSGMTPCFETVLAGASAVAYPPSLPGAGTTVAARGPGRQVNFRLPPSAHAELEHAAQIVHMRPTALARLLVTRGVTQILQEATENA